jgi:hypothetical protein
MVKIFQLKFCHKKINTDENFMACFKMLCTLDNKKLDPSRLLPKKMEHMKCKVDRLSFE